MDPRDGSTVRIIERPALYIRQSPDGRALAYNTGEKDVWVYRADGTDATNRKVADIPGLPVWAEDGASLVCTSEDKHQTFRIPLDGARPDGLPFSPADRVHDRSPDGRWFLITSEREDDRRHPFQVSLTTRDGQVRRHLTRAGFNIRPRFSPDGRSVVYVQLDGRLAALWVTDVAGGSPRRLLEGVGVEAAACWSPDGEFLVVSDHKNVGIIDRAGKNRWPLVKESPFHIGAVEWVRKAGGRD